MQAAPEKKRQPVISRGGPPAFDSFRHREGMREVPMFSEPDLYPQEGDGQKPGHARVFIEAQIKPEGKRHVEPILRYYGPKPFGPYALDNEDSTDPSLDELGLYNDQPRLLVSADIHASVAHPPCRSRGKKMLPLQALYSGGVRSMEDGDPYDMHREPPPPGTYTVPPRESEHSKDHHPKANGRWREGPRVSPKPWYHSDPPA